MKRSNKQNNENVTREYGRIDFVSVERVRENDYGVFFTMVLNGVTINNCKIMESKNGDFIALPSYKGTNGKYYNYVYFNFSPDDTKRIIEMIEKKLN